MKKLALLILAIVVAFATPAFAEVQNVKVGGDIITTYEWNKDLDLDNGNRTYADNTFINTSTRLYVSADLTDNVQAYVRVINERDWDAADNVREASGGGDIEIDCAYVKLSEFLYSPLTITLGRQEIFWGSGLVVGDGVVKPDTSATTGIMIRDQYLSQKKGFDAIRITLDYDPWMIDGFYARIDENSTAATYTQVSGGNVGETREDLMGVNVSYVWPNEVLTEAYAVLNRDSDDTNLEDTKRTTVGARAEGVIDVIDERLSGEAEFAYQMGDYNSKREVKAMAIIAGLTYEFDFEYNPVLSVKYDFRSGDSFTKTDATRNYENWNAQYNDYSIGNLIQKTWVDAAYSQDGTSFPRGAGGNIVAFTTSASVEPLEDVLVAIDAIWAASDEKQHSQSTKDIGVELIGTVMYDYTEDVTLAVQASWLNQDKAYKTVAVGTDNNTEPYEVIGSVKVEF
jgi:hypothetical protein